MAGEARGSIVLGAVWMLLISVLLFWLPVLWATYAEVVAVVQESLVGLRVDERRAVWHDTAARVYRLG